MKYFFKIKKLMFLSLMYTTGCFSSLKLTSLQEILKNNPQISYQKIHNEEHFEYQAFPFTDNKTINKEFFAETFVLKIPHAEVCSKLGLVKVGEAIIDEVYPKYGHVKNHTDYIQKIFKDAKRLKKVAGRVAVITRHGVDTYFHWLVDVLSRFALLELSGQEYDWLYVPYNHPYIKDSLSLFGVDPKKIIEPKGDNYYIQADELIVPSLTSVRPLANKNSGTHCDFVQQWILLYLKEKFLNSIDFKKNNFKFCSKVFISRKNARRRKLLNEDEVFAIFEKKGFKRYELEKMSLIEQVVLFHLATHIVGSHGSGFINAIFCEKKVCIIELFQNWFNMCFFKIFQNFDFKYNFFKSTNNDGANNKNFIVNMFQNDMANINQLKKILEKIDV